MIYDEIMVGEGRRLEFKEILPAQDKIFQTIIAFSNGAGGKLLIGVRDDRSIVGVSDDEIFTIPDTVASIIHDTCHPMIIPEIYVENIDGKSVLVIEVPNGGLKPYYLKQKGKISGTYLRVGATNRLADQEMIQSFERQRLNISFDEELLPHINMNALDIPRLIAEMSELMRRSITELDLINLKL